MMRFFKYTSIVLISLSVLLISFLYAYKYMCTKDISEEPDNLSIKTYRHKDKVFKYGMKGDYPFLKMSVNKHDWKSIYADGFLTSLVPSGLNFYSINSIDNTIWIECLHSCHESDCETYLYDYYYSHDNGDTWYSLKKQTGVNSPHGLSFKDDNYGVCFYEENNTNVCLVTKDGGRIWRKVEVTKRN